jgi:hypothetical protein
MTTRFADLTAKTLASLGLAAQPAKPDAAAIAAAAAAEAAANAPADEEDGEDGADDESGENADGTPKKGKKKGKKETPMPADCDADAEAAVASGMKQAADAATAAANARWADVLGSDEAKGKTAQAIVMLGSTGLDAAAVKAAISKFPKEAGGGLADRMAAEGNPNVTATGGGGEAPKPAEAVKSAFAASHKRLFGA